MSTVSTASLDPLRSALLMACLAAACSFDRQPSLGWQELAQPSPAPPPPATPNTNVFDAAPADAASDTPIPSPAAGSTAPSSPPPVAAGSNAPGLRPVVDADAGPGPPPDAAAARDASIPDASTAPATCPVGTYSGNYMCTIDVTSTVMMMTYGFELRAASAGVATTDSGIMFDYAGSIFAATLDGQLDCASGVFHAEILNGTGLLAPIPVLAGFTGKIDAQLQRSDNKLVGNWTLLSPINVGNCVGPWEASR